MTSDPRPETRAITPPPLISPEIETKTGARAQESPPATAEEQMEQFERDLKNNDWGHQPC